jgi:hypothetical protein
VRAKILPLFFGELEAGKAKTLEAKIKQKKRGTFLKTNELSIEGENHARPVSSLSPPQRALRGGLPQLMSDNYNSLLTTIKIPY